MLASDTRAHATNCTRAHAANGEEMVSRFGAFQVDSPTVSDLTASVEGKVERDYVFGASQMVKHKSVNMTSNRPGVTLDRMHPLSDRVPPPDTVPWPMLISQVQTHAGDLQPQKSENGHGLARMSKEEYAQYDIDPTKIESGEDKRTTVMIRHLMGTSRHNSLWKLLHHCNLESRHNFFHIPCKSHRNVYADFAFVNLLSPGDVLTLWNAVRKQTWHSNSPGKGIKTLAVSYAKMQGLDQLHKHVDGSMSAKKQIPKKSPAFLTTDTSCPPSTPAYKEGCNLLSQACPRANAPGAESSNQHKSHLSILELTDRLFVNVLFDIESPPCNSRIEDVQHPDARFYSNRPTRAVALRHCHLE